MATHKPTEVRPMKKLLVGLTVLLLHTAAAHAQQILPEPVPPQVTTPPPPPRPRPPRPPLRRLRLSRSCRRSTLHLRGTFRRRRHPFMGHRLRTALRRPISRARMDRRPISRTATRLTGTHRRPTTLTHPRSPSAMFSIARSRWAEGSGLAVSSSKIIPPGTRFIRTVSPTPSAWDSGWNRGCCCCGTSRAPQRTTERRRSLRRRTCWRCRSS